MYQVMIIDDEMIVRDGIKCLIDWEDYNFEVCAEGYDGKDGLKKVLEYSPDLVLVDVKMPGMSGIELIREAKKAGFEGKFIILTGYSDFEFAKSAVSLGVRAYLLKPIDEDELLENVKELLAELDAKKHLDDYYTLSELKARQQVLSHLLLHTSDREALKREIKLYGMDFKYNSFCAAILKDRESSEENGISQDKIDLMLWDMEHVDKVIMDDKLVLICKGLSYEEVKKQLLISNEKVKKRFTEGFFIAVGHSVTYWQDLHFSYESAKLLSEYQFSFKEMEAVGIETLKASGITEDKEFPELLLNFIEIGDMGALKEAIREKEELYRGRLIKEWDIKVQITQCISYLHHILEKKYDKYREQFKDEYQKYADRMKKAESLSVLLNNLYNFCDEISKVICVVASENVIKRMIAYMEKNYGQDLKLESIAKLFNYNSAYLGKIFKKEIGENFNNVLDAIRIKNAKRLLQETDLKVYQISEQVGYSNIDYFYSKFKKYVGISPKEFKRTEE